MPDYLIRVRTLPSDDVPPELRLKVVLKRFIRPGIFTVLGRCKLRCLDVREIPEPSPHVQGNSSSEPINEQLHR